MTATRPVVLVTGANGFVGRHLSVALEARGWTARRAQRVLSGGDHEVQIGAIGPQTDWRAALDGVAAVVHLAARVHHPNEENAGEIYRTINTEGTLQLARSAAAAGVQRFVYLSTILVNGATTEGREPFREEDDLKPRGVYGMSKVAAESGLAPIAAQTGMQVSIVRPPLIYGTGAAGNFQLLVKAVRRGVPLPFASIRNRRAFLGVQNLCSFIAHRLAAPGGNLETFLVADGEQVSTPEFVRQIAAAVGTSARLLPGPEPVLRWLLKLGGRAEAGDSLIGSLEIDMSKALASGWRPELSLEAGLRLAVGAPRQD
ncbi:NAD-dependent epimerase/dehydratase family protein [Bradyrhizobium sp. LjRoot220]|uniref:NAD-dependent epimerase/dehydratase family protein n=1 Tax=Bradyrhizobium sp. LjRoot220 TaxID=3342284 RepID=UPI003ED1177F